jgi:5-formyltetrahydrofolate cyclo-ligase
MSRRVAGLSEFRSARVLGIFLSLPWEIDSKPLIAAARREGKTVAVPVVFPDQRGLRFAVLRKGQARLKKNVYGILEPAQPEWVDAIDLLIVPGAAFTGQGDRLGAGAGYYDRFLERHSRLPSVGVGFDEQMAVRLPRGPHDQRVGMVATPSRLYRHV